VGISWKMRWTKHLTHVLENKKYGGRALIMKCEGNKPLGRPWHKWEFNSRQMIYKCGNNLFYFIKTGNLFPDE